MNKITNKNTVLSVFILLAFMLAGYGIYLLQNTQLPERMPADFNFVFNYGVRARNQIDTKAGTFIKDMVLAPPETASIKLSDDEMTEIYSIMRGINFLDYPDEFKPKTNILRTPFSTYSIKVTFNGKTKQIYWTDEQASESREAVQLRNLYKRIIEIISNKDEYKMLPEAKGGYM